MILVRYDVIIRVILITKRLRDLYGVMRVIRITIRLRYMLSLG